MIHVQCPGCLTQAFLECSCPDGHTDATGAHMPSCAMGNPGAAVTCDPDSTHPNCCHLDHDHDAVANACPGGHDDEPCPEEPGKCKVWKGAIADAFHPLHEPGTHPLFSGTEIPPCPGGHCHKQIGSCTVCRPLIITAPSGGYTVVRAVSS